MESLLQLLPLFATLGTILGSVWFLALWLSKQFTNVRNLVYTETAKLRTDLGGKLEYHERHDDGRFAEIRNSIWEVRLRMAADGIGMNERLNLNEARSQQS